MAQVQDFLGGLVRLNFTKRGTGVSIGVPGLRISFGADGKKRRTTSIPGTGMRKTDRL